jgi:hypothetical protein
MGPATASETGLYEARQASGTDEIAVPVAQVPLDVLLSLPAAITLNSSQKISLTNALVSDLYADTVPAGGSYHDNTWGSLLTDAGLAPISSGSPTTGQFLDTGNLSAKTGGWTPISVEVRQNGADTTQALKNYLFEIDSSAYLDTDVWVSPIFEDNNAYGLNEWPRELSGETNYLADPSPGNRTDAEEVLATDGTPGAVGYATAGDAAYNSGGGTSYTDFAVTPTSSTDPPKAGDSDSASHQILYAQLQDNGVSATPVYANPEGSGGNGNLYTGSHLNVNGDEPSYVGSWTVPYTLKTGSWAPTEASDPDVYHHSGEHTYYGLELVLWNLSWYEFAALPLQTKANYTTQAGATAAAFIQFETSSAGQSDINSSGYYYAELPSAILADAQGAAAEVNAGG